MAHIVIYFLALFSLSTSPTWAKINQMPPEILGFWRLFIATVLLFAYLTYKKRALNLFRGPDGPSNQVNRNIFWVILSGFFFFLHLWTYKYASKHTLVSNTMILFATNPIWASLGAVLFFKEKLKWHVGLAYVLAFSGLGYFLYESLHFAPDQKWGNWSAMISALFYAIYMMAGKRARADYENSLYSFYQYLTCAICFGITSLLTGAKFIEGYTLISWIAVLGLVFIPTMLGHLGLTYLVKYMDLSLLTCGKLIEPVLASILAYFVFNEVLMDGAGIAFILTATAVFVLFWPQIKNTRLKLR